MRDGRGVREVTLASIADTVAMVTPESDLFQATIRDDIAHAKAEGERRRGRGGHCCGVHP